MAKKIAIHWFRQDLRLSDNPALAKAAEHENVLPIYILDDENRGNYAMGQASRWWLHHSLKALSLSLDNKLSLYQGDPHTILENILLRFDVGSVCWNRCYEPWRMHQDMDIKERLKARGIESHIYNGSLLWEPSDVKKDDGNPYKIFTPFYRNACSHAETPRAQLLKPHDVRYIYDQDEIGIDAFNLLPDIPWDKKLEQYWDIGEEAAQRRFEIFVKEGISFYDDGRDLPAKPYVSRLSPHLHFGEISPNQLWHAVNDKSLKKHSERFCSELGWREFSYSQLYYNPELPHKNLQSKFDAFPWVENIEYLHAWQTGMTGIPMVDAGMRELWQTGYMHNRVRMIVGSFLVKNLRLHWRYGERWFWDTLVDADLANNSANWQWIAGCGADAAPYFRIFNPVTQGQKFDSNGEYIRQYIPEIASLPNKYLFNPWDAPAPILEECGIKLGATYPHPIVDLKRSRESALMAFRSINKA